ncbi:MAG: hypothetical protein ACRDD8_09740 [Bacteroidales bacterium]
MQNDRATEAKQRMRAHRRKHPTRNNWESRTEGSVISVVLSCLIFILSYTPWVNTFGWVQAIAPYWYYPVLVWICICITVYFLGIIFKEIVKHIK